MENKMDNNLEKNTEITDECTAQSSVEKAEAAAEEKKAPPVPPHREYAKRVARFKKFYAQLLAIIGAVMLGALAVAIFYSLPLGIIIAVVAALLYRFFVLDEMFKQLGIKYTGIVGGISITACEERYGDVLWIPSSLIFFDVTEISDRAFTNKADPALRCVFIPRSVKTIGENIFENITSVTEIRYEGTQEEWKKIEKKSDFSDLSIFFEAKYPPIPKKKKKQKNK